MRICREVNKNKALMSCAAKEYGERARPRLTVSIIGLDTMCSGGRLHSLMAARKTD